MADTIFTDETTVITADWANDVNDHIFGDAESTNHNAADIILQNGNTLVEELTEYSSSGTSAALTITSTVGQLVDGVYNYHWNSTGAPTITNFANGVVGKKYRIHVRISGGAGVAYTTGWVGGPVANLAPAFYYGSFEIIWTGTAWVGFFERWN